MVALFYIVFLCVVFIYGGWFIGKLIGEVFISEKKDSFIFIDNSVHHHHHQHEHKNISIIDDETKKKIFELKEIQSNEDKNKKSD